MTDEIMERRIEALRAFYEDLSAQTATCFKIGSRYKSDIIVLTDQERIIACECLSFNHTREALCSGYKSAFSIWKSDNFVDISIPWPKMMSDNEGRIHNLRKFHREPEIVKKGICYVLGMDPTYITKKSHSADIQNECQKIAWLRKEFMSGLVFRKSP